MHTVKQLHDQLSKVVADGHGDMELHVDETIHPEDYFLLIPLNGDGQGPETETGMVTSYALTGVFG